MKDTTQGKWITYKMGDDYIKLFNSLQNKHTGWCTSGDINIAKRQVEEGTFYVYYIKKEDDYIPKIGIRMEGNNIAEIRGTSHSQNLEHKYLQVLMGKLKTLPFSKEAYTKVSDISKLISIKKKEEENIELSREDLRFLYEIDKDIEGFGHEKDPEIELIKSKRNQRKDYSLIFNIKEEEVALTKEEYTMGKTKVLLTDLDLSNIINSKDVVMPLVVLGKVNLGRLKDAEYLDLSNTIIKGYINLSSLESSYGLKLPDNFPLNNLFCSDNIKRELLNKNNYKHR